MQGIKQKEINNCSNGSLLAWWQTESMDKIGNIYSPQTTESSVVIFLGIQEGLRHNQYLSADNFHISNVIKFLKL